MSDKSDTPRTDAAWKARLIAISEQRSEDEPTIFEFARTLERELAQARAELAERAAYAERWIPCRDRMPEGVTPEFDGAARRSARVVVRITGPQCWAIAFATCVHYKHDGWAPAWSVEGWRGDFSVTDWMPLPPEPADRRPEGGARK